MKQNLKRIKLEIGYIIIYIDAHVLTKLKSVSEDKNQFFYSADDMAAKPLSNAML